MFVFSPKSRLQGENEYVHRLLRKQRRPREAVQVGQVLKYLQLAVTSEKVVLTPHPTYEHRDRDFPVNDFEPSSHLQH